MTYLNNLRKRWACKLHPETAEKAKNYEIIMADLREIHNLFGPIPEIKQVTEWVLGKDWEKTTKNNSVRTLYPTYLKYRSLTHFKDVLLNEYKRKTKDRV